MGESGLRSTDIERYIRNTIPENLEVTARFEEGYIKAMLKPLYTAREALIPGDTSLKEAIESLEASSLPVLVHNELGLSAIKFSGSVYQSLLAYSRLFKNFELFRMLGDELLWGVPPIVFRGGISTQEIITHTDMGVFSTDDSFFTDMQKNVYPVIRYDIPYAADLRAPGPLWGDLLSPTKEMFYPPLGEVADFLTLVIPARIMVILNTVPSFYWSLNDDVAYFRFLVNKSGHLNLLTSESHTVPEFSLSDSVVPDELHLMNETSSPTLDISLESDDHLYLQDPDDQYGAAPKILFKFDVSGMSVLTPEDPGDPDWDGDLFAEHFAVVDWEHLEVITNIGGATVTIHEEDNGVHVIYAEALGRIDWVRVKGTVYVAGEYKEKFTQFNFDWGLIHRFMGNLPLYCLRIYVDFGGF